MIQQIVGYLKEMILIYRLDDISFDQFDWNYIESKPITLSNTLEDEM